MAPAPNSSTKRRRRRSWGLPLSCHSANPAKTAVVTSTMAAHVAQLLWVWTNDGDTNVRCEAVSAAAIPV